jgi:hypothetical protein
MKGSDCGGATLVSDSPCERRLTFPPLVKGGPGEVGTLASRIVDRFPLFVRGSEIRSKWGDRPFEIPVIGYAGTTPPNPPFARGGKGTTSTPSLLTYRYKTTHPRDISPTQSMPSVREPGRGATP